LEVQKNNVPAARLSHMRNLLRRKASPRRGALFLLLALAVSGCATVSDGGPAAVAERPAGLPESFQEHLDKLQSTAPIVLADSPWGTNVAVQVHAPYFAASGRTCRPLTIEPSGERRPGLVCRQQGSEWKRVRVLHHEGRPLLQGTGASRGRGAE
jgi:hypothetical protein